MLFAVFFKFTWNAVVPWKTALVSAALIGIALYVAHSNINSTFGTTSILALLMIWVYYSSQILFIGASFAYVFGQQTGSEIRPTKQVVKII
jgi:membrane protein